MAKQIPIALQTSRDGGATTECLLVKITCKGVYEGIVLGFTSLDAGLDYDDGTGLVNYSPDYGFTPSAFASSNGTSVDNAEVIGFLLDSAITYEMVRAGLFSFAEVVAYKVDYLDLSKGHEIEFTGTCGETTFTDTTWKTEFRSITQQLAQTISQPYSKDTCRAQFGDNRCGMAFEWIMGSVDAQWADDTARGFTCAGLTQDSGYFVPGVVEWLTGRNAGAQMDVVQFDGGFVRLLLQMPFAIDAGDTFRIRRDCDKSTAMCIAYGNEPNYRMEPLINLTGEGLYSFTAARVDQNYGSLIVGAIGAIIGAIVGYGAGAKVGFEIGSVVGGLILPDTAVGPRLAQANAQTNAVTTQIPFGYGRVTMSGNVIEAGDSSEHTKKKKNILGITSSKTYTYTRSFKIGVMQGPIGGILEIRRDGAVIYTSESADVLIFNALVGAGYIAGTSAVQAIITASPYVSDIIANPNTSNLQLLWLDIKDNAPNHGGIDPNANMYADILMWLPKLKTASGLYKTQSDTTMHFFRGTEDQEFFDSANIDTDGLNPAYKGLAYVAFDDYDVTQNGGALPTFEFVVDATIPDIYLTSHPYTVESCEDMPIAGRAAAPSGNLHSQVQVAFPSDIAPVAGSPSNPAGSLHSIIQVLSGGQDMHVAGTPSNPGGALSTIVIVAPAQPTQDMHVAGTPSNPGGALSTIVIVAPAQPTQDMHIAGSPSSPGGAGLVTH